MVFRHLLKKQDASERKFVGFLAINGNRDPSDDLMARFRAFKPPLKKVSKCVRKPKSNGHWVKEKGTGKEGIILSVDPIQWLNPQTADVRSGDYVGGRWASSATYHVVWKRGQWVIEGAKDAIQS